MSEQTLDMMEMRDKYLQQLRIRIESAFEAGKNKQNVDDSEKRRKMANKIMHLEENESVNFLFIPESNQVWVDDPHDYPDLLKSEESF